MLYQHEKGLTDGLDILENFEEIYNKNKDLGSGAYGEDEDR